MGKEPHRQRLRRHILPFASSYLFQATSLIALVLLRCRPLRPHPSALFVSASSGAQTALNGCEHCFGPRLQGAACEHVAEDRWVAC